MPTRVNDVEYIFDGENHLLAGLRLAVRHRKLYNSEEKVGETSVYDTCIGCTYDEQVVRMPRPPSGKNLNLQQVTQFSIRDQYNCIYINADFKWLQKVRLLTKLWAS